MSKTFLYHTIHFSQTVLFSNTQFSISIDVVFTNFIVKKTVLLRAIQKFSSIWPTERNLSGANNHILTKDDCGLASDGNKEVLRIPQSSSITETSPTVSLQSYQGQTLVRDSTLWRDEVSVFYSPSRLSKSLYRYKYTHATT